MGKTLFVAFLILGFLGLNGAKKTVMVVPEDAKIFLNGMEVGSGMYTINFDRNTEFVNLRFEAPGYITRKVKLLKNNPKKTVSYDLKEDDAWKASYGAEDGNDQANRWFTVNCKPGITEDVIWKRLSQITINNFEQCEVRDKAAGWIKSGWTITRFPDQTVRTQVEVRIQFTDGDTPSYRVRLTSQIKDNDCKSNQCWETYPRLLKKYADVVQEYQTSLGSNF